MSVTLTNGDRSGKTEPPDPRSLSTYDRTKDISFHPYFRGGISRWMWRLFMYRLTAPGRWFLGLTAFLVLYGSTSIDLQIFAPLLYAFGLWLIAWLIAMIYPPRASLVYRTPERVAVDSIVPINLEITSVSRSPMVEITIIPMRLPPQIDCLPPDGVKIQELGSGECCQIHVDLICRKRGVYSVKGFRVETAFPLGLLRSYSNHWHMSRLLVYPTFRSLTNIDLPSDGRYQPGGVALASKLGDSMEYIGNREYRDGDNIRDIDWRATARLTRPIIREYREEYFYRVGVIQDTFVPRGSLDRERDLERAISICAAVSDYMARKEYVVDLFAAGPDLYHLTAGRSLAFQDQILDILACLEPAQEQPFQIIEPELLENLAALTTVICVMLDWDEIRRAFVQRIRQVSEVKVIVVRDAPCSLDPSAEASDLTFRLIGRQEFEGGVESL